MYPRRFNISILILCLFLCFLLPHWAGSDIPSVNDWLYVISLDNVSIEDIAQSGYDLVVMDYSKTGTEEGEFPASQITQIKQAGMIAIAYFSIGEAEDYRFYWREDWNRHPPAWLGPVNPDWPGNFKVRYWQEGWQTILLGTTAGEQKSYLDRIIDQGFDGVYLDIVDAFEYWSEENVELSRRDARQFMKQLIGKIRTYALQTRGLDHFYVFPQNAPAIVVDEDDQLDDLGREYLQLCDGIGAEDTWYNETERQDQEEADFTTSLLDRFRDLSLSHLVLSVDYVWDGTGSQENTDRYNEFHRLAHQRGYLPYAAWMDRDLNEIVKQEQDNRFLFSQPVANEPVTRLDQWFMK